MGRASDVAWNAHSDRSVTAQIDKLQLVRNRDLGILADMEFVLGQRKVADDAVAPITQHRFHETSLERLAQVKNGKAIPWNTSARIAEAARSLANTERVGVAGQVQAAEQPPGADCCRFQLGGRKCRGRPGSNHLGGIARDALRRFNDLLPLALLQRFAAA